jgi:hypothetical protein
MATKKNTALAPATASRALATIDSELASEVANLKNQIGQPSGNKIKVEASGDFILPDGMNLGNEIQVVVLDFISRNFFYSGPYNPNNISPPDCYAMGKEKASMAPEDDSPAKQNDKCGTCPLNAFGSGNNGKSKACQNRYWLAVLLVNPENPDEHNDPAAPVYILDLSPSNLRSFEGAVSTIARTLAGPPLKALLTVTAKNVGTYAQVTFTDPLPNPDYAAHAARRSETVDVLHRRPDFAAAAAAAPANNRGRGAQPARRAAAGARR